MNDALTIDDFQRMLWHFAATRILTVAGRTGILHLLAERTATPEETAAALDLDAHATGKVIRSLCAQGVVVPDGDSYRLASALRADFLGNDDDLGPFVEHIHTMYDRWGASLEPWLRGQDWPTTPRTPEEAARFGAAMKAMGGRMARRVAAALDLEGVRTMLDVGGGWGQYAKAFRTVNPGIEATVLDVPDVADQAPPDLAGTEHEGHISWIGGDYLETDYGSGYDLVLLSNILHQETAPRAAELTRRAAAALAPGGRVVIVDFAIDDAKREHWLGTLFAINMRSFGDAWSAPEYTAWLTHAGLTDIQRQDLGPDRWIISGYRR